MERLLPQQRAPIEDSTMRFLKAAQAIERPSGKRRELHDTVNWRKVLRQLRIGPCAGPDGWRPETLLSVFVTNPGKVSKAFKAYAEAFCTGA